MQPLPLPSSETIASSSTLVPTAAYSTRPTELRVRAKTRALHPRSHLDGHWTNFYEMNHDLSHLNQEQYLEAWNIMEQDHPFAQPARNFYEEAFFYDEVYKEDRARMQQQADLKRWERLVELGVVSTEGDEIYDWEEIQEPELWMVWRLGQPRGWEENGKGQPRPWRLNTTSTWFRRQWKTGLLLQLTCGNYLVDELYVLNLPISMTSVLCSPGTSSTAMTSRNQEQERMPSTPWTASSPCWWCWNWIAGTTLSSTRTWTTATDLKSGMSFNVVIDPWGPSPLR